METESIKFDIDVHDHLPNDLETEHEKWYTSITIYGNDRKHENNAGLCKIISKVKNNHFDLETFSISEEMYELAKEKTRNYYSTVPLKKKTLPDLSREERMKKQMEYLTSELKNK